MSYTTYVLLSQIAEKIIKYLPTAQRRQSIFFWGIQTYTTNDQSGREASRTTSDHLELQYLLSRFFYGSKLH